MNKNWFETLTGAVVIFVAGWFALFFVKHNTGIEIASDHYQVFAKFEQADGVAIGTPVRIGGVKVGVITDEELDLSNYFAVVKFTLEKKIKIPVDSTAKIVSEGLIGGKYLSIIPGADDRMLQAGEELKYTQSSVSIENLIGKMVFSKENAGSK